MSLRSFINLAITALETTPTRDLLEISSVIVDRANHGGKVIIVGNGGSAAIASHLAIDFTKSAGVRAISFNDSSLITCFANDYGYSDWVEKAIDFYADPDDILILISSSGRSSNIINAAKRGMKRGLYVVTLSGFDSDNSLRFIGSKNLWLDSHNYNVVESTHCAWLLGIVEEIRTHKGKS